MHRLPRHFSETYRPGAVLLYLDDLERLVEIMNDGQGVNITADLDSTNDGSPTHLFQTVEELRAHLGRRLRRSLVMHDNRHEITLGFHPVIGVRLSAEGSDTEPRYRRAAAYLKDRRRAFAWMLRIPAWIYGLALVGVFAAERLLKGQPVYTSPNVWAAVVLTIVALVGRVKWGIGTFTAVHLVRRADAEEEARQGARGRRDQIIVGVVCTAAGVLLTLAVQACPSAPKDVGDSRTAPPAVGTATPKQ